MRFSRRPRASNQVRILGRSIRHAGPGAASGFMPGEAGSQAPKRVLLPLPERESRLSVKGVELLALDDVKTVIVDLLHEVEDLLLA